MNFTFLSSLFKKKKTQLQLPDSLLIKKLKELCEENNLYLFQNKIIYHHSLRFEVPLFILDPQRGIYLFEYKEWSYDDLKNATIQKAQKQESASNSLAFEKTHEFMRQKFKELTHTNGVEIFNFLLMENLNADQYSHLDPSFQELLPAKKVIFHDSTKESMLQKLRDVKKPDLPLGRTADILGALLVQYIIFHKDGQRDLCTPEQRAFIDAELLPHETLYAPSGMGKTTLILLKALHEKLKNPKLRIVILQTSILACDILKKRLIQYIEDAMITVDITAIEVITPKEFVNKHLLKLKKPLLDLHEDLILDPKLFQSSFAAADIVFCDDSDFLEDSFHQYLRHVQKKGTLLFVTQKKQEDISYSFSDHSFQKNLEFAFYQGNELALSMHTLHKLLQTNKAKEILIVSDNLNKQKLHEDLEFFIKDKAILLDSTKNLIDLELDSVLLASYDEISALRAKHVLLLDICHTDPLLVESAKSKADKMLHIIYEQKCDKIKDLHNGYKNQKNSSRVERDT